MSRELWVRENWDEYVKEKEERERIRHAESGNTRITRLLGSFAPIFYFICKHGGSPC